MKNCILLVTLLDTGQRRGGEKGEEGRRMVRWRLETVFTYLNNAPVNEREASGEGDMSW